MTSTTSTCIMITLVLTAFVACGHAEDGTDFETYLPENESFLSVDGADTVVPENEGAATSTQDHPIPISDEGEADDMPDTPPPADATPEDIKAFSKAKADAKKKLSKLAAATKAHKEVMEKSPPLPTSTEGFTLYKKWLQQARTSTLQLANLTTSVENEEAGMAIWDVYARLQLEAQHLETRLQADKAAKEDAEDTNKLAQKANDAFYKPEDNKTKTEDLHFFDSKEEMIQMRDDLHDLMRKHKIPHQKLSPEEHNHAISKFIYHMSMGHHETLNDEEFTQALVGVGMGYGQTAATKCVQAAIGAVPPRFCYKGRDYNHDFNMACPHGWHVPSGMAECFEPCRSGYKWAWGGTCWATCPAHHVEIAATCHRSWWGNCCTHTWAPWGRRRARICSPCLHTSTTNRDHYWPSRIPFTSDRMRCRHRYSVEHRNGDTDLQYQAGAACYRRCDSFLPGNGLTGCGLDACAATSTSCAQAIANMIFEIAMAVASIVAIAATAGSAGAATAATRTSMRAVGAKLGAQGAKSLAKATARGLRRSSATQFEKVAWRVAVKRGLKKALRDEARNTPATVRDNWSQNAIKSYCQAQALRIYNNANPDSTSTQDPAAWDPTGVANMVNNCNGDPESMGCKAAIVGAAGNFDPTGLLGVAAAFMHEDCESCDTNCRHEAEQPVVDNLYTKRNNLFCSTYGFDGNRYGYRTLAAAERACQLNPGCGGVKQWNCNSNAYGLCGRVGMQLHNYGAGRCVYT